MGIHLLVFCRKDLCEARPQTPSVFKFSDVLFTLKSDGPPCRCISSQLDICSAFGSGWLWVRCTPPVDASQVSSTFCQPFGQADCQSDVTPCYRNLLRCSWPDLSSDVPHCRSIWWPRLVLSCKLLWVQMCFFLICCSAIGEVSHTLQCRNGIFVRVLLLSGYEFLKIEQESTVYM